MANKALKSIKFPGLEDTYKVPQLAPNFDQNTSYAVGEYCQYQGETYRFTAPHTGAWNASHATAVMLIPELMAATQATAGLHLGFYLDANGDLCQVD